ncbi:Diacylglycerol O-acyltransferase [Durusdinium trenchii]|uniref:Diacylglycerol O-acyltransferase n=1 Tax=Durusdinium trenchii TaxID=1381693 RepID=A0ABP0IE91_9DINO
MASPEEALVAAEPSEHVRQANRPGRKMRASVITRIMSNLQRGGMETAVWVTGLLYLESAPSEEALKQVVMDRLLAMRRFRSRVKVSKVLRRMYWEELDLADFDIDYHLQIQDAEKPLSRDGVRSFLENMYADWEPDMTRSPWQLILLPRLEEGGALLVSRMNHCIGDGVAMVEILMRLLDPMDEEEKEKAKVRPKRRVKSRFGPLNKSRIFLKGFFKGFTAPIDRDDPPNSFQRKNFVASTKRRYALTPEVPLDKIKQIKDKLEGATVNDVAMYLLTITLSKFFYEVNDTAVLNGSRTTFQFPVSLRKRGESAFRDGEPHNHVGYGYMNLHVTKKPPAEMTDDERLALFWKIKREIDAVKLSPTPYVMQYNLRALSFLPLKAINKLALTTGNQATSQLSSVQASPTKVRIAGKTIERMSFTVFSPGSAYCGLISYANQISLSVCLDSSLGVDPELVAKHWVPAMDETYAAVMGAEGTTIKMPRPFLDKL